MLSLWRVDRFSVMKEVGLGPESVESGDKTTRIWGLMAQDHERRMTCRGPMQWLSGCGGLSDGPTPGAAAWVGSRTKGVSLSNMSTWTGR